MFWEKYYNLCQNVNSSPNGVAKIIGVSNATCTKWKSGAVPTGDTLVKIAGFFDCSVDYLLGRTDNPKAHKSTSVSFGDMFNNSGIVGNVGSTINAASADEQIAALVDIYKSLSPVEQAKLLVYADSLKAEKH